MPAALPKAPRACPGVKPWPLLDVASSTYRVASRNPRFPNEIRASSRFYRFLGRKKGQKSATWRIGAQSAAQRAQSQIQRTTIQQKKPRTIRRHECLGFGCGMWQEAFDKKLLNRESFLYVEGTQVVRADDLKGEFHNSSVHW